MKKHCAQPFAEGERAFVKTVHRIARKLRQPPLKLAVLTQADSDCILNFVSGWMLPTANCFPFSDGQEIV